jgi:hypothetical protein
LEPIEDAVAKKNNLTCPPEIGPELLIGFGSDFHGKEQGADSYGARSRAVLREAIDLEQIARIFSL